MRKNRLLKLPLGVYVLTNGIYTYTLEKYIWEDPIYNKNRDASYRISLYGSHAFHDPSITLHYEYIEDVYEYTSKYKRFSFVSHILVFGLSVMGPCRFLHELKFVPRGSFKEFIERTAEIFELAE